MKSIRWSLIVYFLVLLALALGAVSLFVYWTTYHTLLAKQETTRQLLVAQHEERRREERAKLDDRLLFQARTLATLARSEFQWGRIRFQALYPLGLLTAGPAPNGYVLAPTWIAAGSWGPLAYLLAREIQFAEDDLHRPGDGPDPEYFQLYSEWGHPLQHSASLADSLTLDSDLREKIGLFEWRFDDTVLQPGVPVRRVTLKVPVARFLFPPGPSPRRFSASSSPRPARTVSVPPERYAERPLPAIFIQCAADVTRLTAELDQLGAKLDQDLANLDEESQATLAALGYRLLGISLITFAATVVGGFWLVQFGLSPLRRLSDAVSRVSEKDFRLQFDEPHLPRELRPIAERLKQTLELLKRAFTREKQAAADISHELRTPLAALLATIELALRKPRTPDEYRNLLKDCQVSGRQMNQLVERLLLLALLDAGVDTLRPEEVDVAALAEQCAALVQPLAEARDLTMSLDCPGESRVNADPVKLREVLTNLLHNAIEYNRPQGSVELRVERQNGRLQVEVRDTGIGMNPEACEHVFERFYRADPSRQADGLHAGLGLAIVKGYVDLMGGTIAVRSTVGQGTSFRLDLPIR